MSSSRKSKATVEQKKSTYLPNIFLQRSDKAKRIRAENRGERRTVEKNFKYRYNRL